MAEPKCPYCNGEIDCEFTDIGVGVQQTSAYKCLECYAEQISPYELDLSDCSSEERRIGWRRGITVELSAEEHDD